MYFFWFAIFICVLKQSWPVSSFVYCVWVGVSMSAVFLFASFLLRLGHFLSFSNSVYEKLVSNLFCVTLGNHSLGFSTIVRSNYSWWHNSIPEFFSLSLFFSLCRSVSVKFHFIWSPESFPISINQKPIEVAGRENRKYKPKIRLRKLHTNLENSTAKTNNRAVVSLFSILFFRCSLFSAIICTNFKR